MGRWGVRGRGEDVLLGTCLWIRTLEPKQLPRGPPAQGQPQTHKHGEEDKYLGKAMVRLERAGLSRKVMTKGDWVCGFTCRRWRPYTSLIWSLSISHEETREVFNSHLWLPWVKEIQVQSSHLTATCASSPPDPCPSLAHKESKAQRGSDPLKVTQRKSVGDRNQEPSTGSGQAPPRCQARLSHPHLSTHPCGEA